MKKIYISTIAAALLFTVSCQTDFENSTEDVVVTSGEADFSKYIALGNSLTSGYRDNALYVDGQKESYPNLIAGQMKLAGGGEFVQPLMADNNGGMVLGTTPILATKLYISGFANGVPVLKNVQATPTTDVTKKVTGTINNMGVPGAKSFHLIAPGYGNVNGILAGTANPYYVRFSTSNTSTVAADAAAQKPTFFSLWIGNNDVLSYATNGGTNTVNVNNVVTYVPATVQTSVDPSTYKSNDISSPQVVAGSIKTVLETLKASGTTKGIIANIPYVTSIPYFTTVPYNAIPLTSAKAQALNAALYEPMKNALTYLGAGSRLNLVKAGQNPVLIVDNKLTNLSVQITAALTANGVPPTKAAMLGNAFGQVRQSAADDLILLPASSLLGIDVATGKPATDTSELVYGASYPIGDQLSLTKDEAASVKSAIDAYNSQIATLASAYGLAFVDANAKMTELNSASGIQWDGVRYSAKFVTGGAFSLDGVHLTGRGYAIVANEFLKAINMKYKSNLPMVSPNSYSGVTFP